MYQVGLIIVPAFIGKRSQIGGVARFEESHKSIESGDPDNFLRCAAEVFIEEPLDPTRAVPGQPRKVLHFRMRIGTNVRCDSIYWGCQHKIARNDVRETVSYLLSYVSKTLTRCVSVRS